MIPLLIGVFGGLITILLINILTRKNRLVYYGLVLCGIGFLYVGYTWTDIYQLVTTCIQAFVFIIFAYYGITRSIYIMAAGYFAHGIWDILYDQVFTTQLIPPHYDIFCLSIDFFIGGYLLIFRKRISQSL